jgi:hypothetical protein
MPPGEESQGGAPQASPPLAWSESSEFNWSLLHHGITLEPPPPTTYVNSSQVSGELLWLLPELKTGVRCPNWVGNMPTEPAYDVVDGHVVLRDKRTWICHDHTWPVYAMVQHLNDGCGWTREQVADWLETLDVDLTFPTEPPSPRPWRPVESVEIVVMEKEPAKLAKWDAQLVQKFQVSSSTITFDGVIHDLIWGSAKAGASLKAVGKAHLSGLSIGSSWLDCIAAWKPAPEPLKAAPGWLKLVDWKKVERRTASTKPVPIVDRWCAKLGVVPRDLTTPPNYERETELRLPPHLANPPKPYPTTKKEKRHAGRH